MRAVRTGEDSGGKLLGELLEIKGEPAQDAGTRGGGGWVPSLRLKNIFPPCLI